MLRLIEGKNIPRWNKYCPHEPWPRQWDFLDVTQVEALYGGAAAGGKSEALLMAALQYVHVPGYSALILRKDLARLRLAGGLLDRAAQWFTPTAATWNERKEWWSFPTSGRPATISFGYLAHPGDKYRYGSSEYQLIAFDELTEFEEEDYLFLFSRLRRTENLPVPLRMRAATNPGGPGHAWVKQRFVTDTQPSADGILWYKEDRAFVPARIRDNPAVPAEEYLRSLSHLPPIARARLLDGDWSVQEEGLLRLEWLRRFRASSSEQRLTLLKPSGASLAEVAAGDCIRVATIDPAGTSQDKVRQRRGQTASHSVIQVWDMFYQPWAGMALRHTWRRQVGFDQLCHAIAHVYESWKPSGIWIENEKLGHATVDVLRSKLPIQTIATGGKDKVARAARLIHMLEQGQVFLPQAGPAWLDPLEQEWLSWTGHPNDAADQIDPAAYAAQLFARYENRGPTVVMRPFG